MGEQDIQAVGRPSRVAVDTFAGRIHVEWDPDAAVTPMGQLPFFIEFLKVSGLYDAQGNIKRGMSESERKGYDRWAAVAIAPATPFAMVAMRPEATSTRGAAAFFDT